MKNTSGIAFLLVLAVIAILVYVFWKTLPSKQEIESNAKKIEVLKKEDLKSEVVAKVKGFEVNGQLPVKADPASQGRDDPFQPF